MDNDLEFDFAKALLWFHQEQDSPYVLVQVSDENAKSWAECLGLVVRRCYLSDSAIDGRIKDLGVDEVEIIAARLPDSGSTMAGDFGEIIVYLYQGSQELPAAAIGPKKWRLKQDRTKPAPHSDVVQFVLPTWPEPSPNDVLLCSEVKTKSTEGDSTPIQSAIEDSAKDRISRLARTLVWLRERALLESLGDVHIEHLDRFINSTDYPPAKKRFRAVAVICKSLLVEELKNAPVRTAGESTLVIIAVPDLKRIYTEVFGAALRAVSATSNKNSVLPVRHD